MESLAVRDPPKATNATPVVKMGDDWRTDECVVYGTHTLRRTLDSGFEVLLFSVTSLMVST